MSSTAPVASIGDAPQPLHTKAALCDSGGGYRAMLFRLGSFWRLNALGELPSGRTMTAARLALSCLGERKPRLNVVRRP
jgi:hypothetical protein